MREMIKRANTARIPKKSAHVRLHPLTAFSPSVHRYSCVSHWLESYPASEIVLPDTLENGGLATMLMKNDHGFVTFVKRQHFSDNKGRDLLAVVAAACDTGVETDAKDAYLALASFHALVKYAPARTTINDILHRTLRPISLFRMRALFIYGIFFAGTQVYTIRQKVCVRHKELPRGLQVSIGLPLSRPHDHPQHGACS